MNIVVNKDLDLLEVKKFKLKINQILCFYTILDCKNSSLAIYKNGEIVMNMICAQLREVQPFHD